MSKICSDAYLSVILHRKSSETVSLENNPPLFPDTKTTKRLYTKTTWKQSTFLLQEALLLR